MTANREPIDERPITDPRVLAAVTELTELVRARYPEATFSVGRGQDDPEAIYVYATVDLEDTEPVVDLVIERELELHLTEGLPVQVIPLRTPERNAAIVEALEQARLNPHRQAPSLGM
jgi:hypothetical protein